ASKRSGEERLKYTGVKRTAFRGHENRGWRRRGEAWNSRAPLGGRMPTLADSLKLPCGALLKNRLAKAAMTEGLADPWNRATERHATLYRRWAEGGAGLLITGNVQVDRRHLERPGNVAIDGPQTDEQRAALTAFAR